MEASDQEGEVLAKTDGTREQALFMAQAARERLAIDPVVLDVRQVASFCEYFVICHGRSSVHVESIVGTILEKMNERHVPPHHSEGGRNAAWTILDYGGVVVHIFTEEARGFYNLEGLWADAEMVEIEAASI